VSNMQVEKVLKALYVRKLFLWPRFHSAVREVVEAESLAAEVSCLPSQSHLVTDWEPQPSVTLSTMPSDVLLLPSGSVDAWHGWFRTTATALFQNTSLDQQHRQFFQILD